MVKPGLQSAVALDPSARAFPGGAQWMGSARIKGPRSHLSGRFSLKCLHWVQGWQCGKEKGTWVAVWAPTFNNWVTVGKSLNFTEPCCSERRLGAAPVACVIGKENLRAYSVCSKIVTCLAVLEGFLVLVRVCATRFQPEVGRSWLG